MAFGPAILPRGIEAGTNGQVSWLEADRLSLPSAGAPVGTSLSLSDSCVRECTQRPLTVAGPRRIYTGFLLRDPFVLNRLSENVSRYPNVCASAKRISALHEYANS